MVYSPSLRSDIATPESVTRSLGLLGDPVTFDRMRYGREVGVRHITDPAMLRLSEQIQELTQVAHEQSKQISELNAAIQLLAAKIDSKSAENAILPDFLVLSDQEVAEKIISYFNAHPDNPMYPDELAALLGLDTLQTITVCENLRDEGKLNVAK